MLQGGSILKTHSIRVIRNYNNLELFLQSTPKFPNLKIYRKFLQNRKFCHTNLKSIENKQENI